MADLTREQIEEWKLEASATHEDVLEVRFLPSELRALCSLALERLAMQPRPIEEAPKDGTRILALWDGEWVVTYWEKRPIFEGWKMPSGMVIKAYDRSAWRPIQFTALPETKQ